MIGTGIVNQKGDLIQRVIVELIQEIGNECLKVLYTRLKHFFPKVVFLLNKCILLELEYQEKLIINRVLPSSKTICLGETFLLWNDYKKIGRASCRERV